MSRGNAPRTRALLGLLAVAVAGCTLTGQKRGLEPAHEVPAKTVAARTAAAAAGRTAPEIDVAPAAEPVAVPATLSERIRRDAAFDDVTHPAVEREVEWFLANPNFFSNSWRRAQPYLYFVLETLEARGLPAEIALLPIVESAYQAGAHSPGGAAGLWQFMPQTGRQLGLRQSRWYDGRLDVVAATMAAADYLDALRARFDNDWLLALAAYNCGPATVERAIERNRLAGKDTDIWSLDLPAVTSRYVPRVLAAAQVVEHAQTFGIDFEPIANEPYFAAVDLGGPLDLRQVLSWTDLSADDFRALNPGFRTWHTDPQGPNSILVPQSAYANVVAALAELPPEERVTARPYTVRLGDTLSGVAQAFASSVGDIRAANGLRGHVIRPGQSLMIPVPGAVDAAAEGLDAPPTRVHTVRRGDTLWDIARLYNKGIGEIAHHNDLPRTTTLQPGQQLSIPGVAAAPARADITHYEVREGDSLWTIARRFGVTVMDLRAWNNLSEGRRLRPGQQLVVNRTQGADPPA